MRARPGRTPRQRVDLVLDRKPEQVVPGGVELDLVHTVPVAVMGAKPRPIVLGEGSEHLNVGAAHELTDCAKAILRPFRALAADGFGERAVALVNVVVDQWRRLVRDPMGDRLARTGERRHPLRL